MSLHYSLFTLLYSLRESFFHTNSPFPYFHLKSNNDKIPRQSVSLSGRFSMTGISMLCGESPPTAMMKSKLQRIDEHLRTMLRVIIWKQWKTAKKREWGLKKLGIGKDMARCTAYCGNRYQWIATKTCLKRAITKEKLTKRGLISLSDYYQKVHI